MSTPAKLGLSPGVRSRHAAPAEGGSPAESPKDRRVTGFRTLAILLILLPAVVLLALGLLRTGWGGAEALSHVHAFGGGSSFGKLARSDMLFWTSHTDKAAPPNVLKIPGSGTVHLSKPGQTAATSAAVPDSRISAGSHVSAGDSERNAGTLMTVAAADGTSSAASAVSKDIMIGSQERSVTLGLAEDNAGSSIVLAAAKNQSGQDGETHTATTQQQTPPIAITSLPHTPGVTTMGTVAASNAEQPTTEVAALSVMPGPPGYADSAEASEGLLPLPTVMDDQQDNPEQPRAPDYNGVPADPAMLGVTRKWTRPPGYVIDDAASRVPGAESMPRWEVHQSVEEAIRELTGLTNTTYEANGMPKLIHIKTKSGPDGLPPQETVYSQGWSYMNPEYQLTIFGDAEAEATVAKFAPDLLDMYKAFPHNVVRADLWKHLILYVLGGVYLDDDVACAKPIREWNNAFDGTANALVGIEGMVFNKTIMQHVEFCCPVQYCSWTMAAVPRHPLHKAVLNRIVRNWQQYQADVSAADAAPASHTSLQILSLAGPHVFSHAVEDHIAQYNVTYVDVSQGYNLVGNVGIMPSSVFGSGGYSAVGGDGKPYDPAHDAHIMVKHMFAGSWRTL